MFLTIIIEHKEALDIYDWLGITFVLWTALRALN